MTFLQRQLEYISQKVFNKQYPELLATSLIPINRETPEGSASITYQMYSSTGIAKFMDSYAKDIPLIDIEATKITVNPLPVASGFHYSAEELRQAEFAGVPLNVRKALHAKEAIDRLIDTTAFIGNATHNLLGLLNNSNVPVGSVPLNAGGTSKRWIDKTVDEIIADVVGAVGNMKSVTNNIEMPDTILLPIAQYTLLQGRRLADTDGNLLTYLEKVLTAGNNGVPFKIVALHYCTGAGASATDRMVIYKADPEKLEQEVPMDFIMHEVQQDGLMYKVPCEAKCGGTVIYRPMSVAYWDGI
jgi:hypothetical protein